MAASNRVPHPRRPWHDRVPTAGPASAARRIADDARRTLAGRRTFAGRRTLAARWALASRWAASPRRAFIAARHAWRRSLQLRMVTLTLVISGLLVGGFGAVVASQITEGLVRD